MGEPKGGQCPHTAAQGLGAKGLQPPWKTKMHAWRVDALRRCSAPPAGTGARAELRCCRATALAVTPGRWGRASRMGPESRGGQFGVRWWWERCRRSSSDGDVSVSLWAKRSPASGGAVERACPGVFQLFSIYWQKGASKGQLCCALCFWIRHA